MPSRSKDGVGTLIALLGACAFLLSAIAAWFTHVGWIVMTLASDKGATVGQIILGVLGAFVPPVGSIHGYIIWYHELFG